MCYPAFSAVGISPPSRHGRWPAVAFQLLSIEAEEEEEEEADPQRALSPAAAAATVGSKQQQCICSPTGHPGSFRCRLHHSSYEWIAMRSRSLILLMLHTHVLQRISKQIFCSFWGV